MSNCQMNRLRIDQKNIKKRWFPGKSFVSEKLKKNSCYAIYESWVYQTNLIIIIIEVDLHYPS